ncbi:ATP-dependent DNA helicase Q4 [Argonauta hians]
MEKLKNLKLALKTWESNFFKENGRKPNSEDIGLSSENIRSAYSRYYKLKRQSLNSSLDSNHSSPKDNGSCSDLKKQSLNSSFNTENSLPKDDNSSSNLNKQSLNSSLNVAHSSPKDNSSSNLNKPPLNSSLNVVHSSPKDDGDGVWGRSFNRSPTKKPEELGNGGSDVKIKQAVYLEKLSTKMFINYKKCSAMRKLTNTRLSQSKSVEKDENLKTTILENSDSLVSNTKNSDNSSSLNSSFSEIISKNSGKISEDFPKEIISPEQNRSGLFKNVLNISSRKQNYKSKFSDSTASPTIFHDKKYRKFSLSSAALDSSYSEELLASPGLDGSLDSPVFNSATESPVFNGFKTDTPDFNGVSESFNGIKTDVVDFNGVSESFNGIKTDGPDFNGVSESFNGIKTDGPDFNGTKADTPSFNGNSRTKTKPSFDLSWHHSGSSDGPDEGLPEDGTRSKPGKDNPRTNKIAGSNESRPGTKLEKKRPISPDSTSAGSARAKRRKNSLETRRDSSMSGSNDAETFSSSARQNHEELSRQGKDDDPEWSTSAGIDNSNTEFENPSTSTKSKRPPPPPPPPPPSRSSSSSSTSAATSSATSTSSAASLSAASSSSASSSSKRMSQINKSENFVRLNMKVKRFSRKGQGTKGTKFKRMEWKRKMREKQKSYGKNCFRCGESGHWAKNCKNAPNSKGYKNKNQLDGDQHQQPGEYGESSANVMEEDYLTLSQAVSMSKGDSSFKQCEEKDELDIEKDVVRDPYELFNKFVNRRQSMEPYLVANEDGSLPEIPEEVYDALKMFGFTTFKDGQADAIMRTLCGLSTLVILSTGGGKSLCYQLPAYLYGRRPKHVAIVVSPLVSLMEDQVDGLPVGINGACLHTNMTPSQREMVISSVNSGKIHFLLLSPEAVIGGQKSVLTELSKDVVISFVCIDEAHCLSEWSHNFRPSYLQVCKALRDKHGVRCFIGLTATATLAQSKHIAQQLWINDVDRAVIRGAPIPKNLVLSISRDVYRDESLIELLEGDRFSKCESIIIYCTRRDQTEKVATLIRTALKDRLEDISKLTGHSSSSSKAKSKKTAKNGAQLIAESYHAGLTAYQRKRIQKSFMSGKLWIVVATVAFGMGIDKSNVRGVIHYNMPKSFESYVQEIGRAGRDGKQSHCHLFIDKEGQDLGELKKHIYANSVSRYVVKKFVQKILKRCRCLEIHRKCSENSAKREEQGDGDGDENEIADNGDLPNCPDSFLCFSPEKRICKGHEMAVSIEPLVQALDMKEENIATLLCYLELSFQGLVRMLPLTYADCKINCYGGPAQLQAVAKKCPPVAVAIAKQKLTGKTFSSTASLEFPVIELSDSMGWNSGIVKRELKGLQWCRDSESGARKSGVMVELSRLAFHFVSFGDLSDDELDHVIDYLHGRVKTQERLELGQIQRLHGSLMSVSYNSICGCADSVDEKRNKKLHQLIFDYFEEETTASATPGATTADTNTNTSTNSSTAPTTTTTTEPFTNSPDASSSFCSATEALVCHFDAGQIQSDVRKFLNIYSQDHNFTGHSIARIFHGIGSPCYPANIWGRVRQFWRCYIGSDFQAIVDIATKEILHYKR